MASQARRHMPYVPQALILAASCLFCLALMFVRIQMTGKVTYIFLAWNLFLAVIPFFLSLLIHTFVSAGAKRWVVFLASFIWLLFFPNALYIITDFVHLKSRHGIPLWYDSLLIFSFAWNGALCGFFSLRILHTEFESMVGRAFGWGFAAFALLVGSFGIYIGRFLRWNSWDIVNNPLPLVSDIITLVRNPADNPQSIAVTAFFFLFLFMAYASMVTFASIRGDERNR